MLLIAKDGRRFLRMDLLPLGDRHWEWHGYSLAFGDVEKGVTAVLQATKDAPLFLDREVTPEILALCDGLERAIEGEPFSFSPVDERDFELSARRGAGGFIVQLQARHTPFSPDTGWPTGVEVTAAAVRRFTAGLRLEYEQLMACLPLR